MPGSEKRYNYKDNEYIKLAFTAQALAAPGRAYCDIVLQHDAQILSTVSFILIIMSAPDVTNECISSNEFGLLTSIVNDATVTIQDSEAWAKGTRGGNNVFSEQSFSVETSESITSVTVDQEDFLGMVGDDYATQRTFNFKYREADGRTDEAENDIWDLEITKTIGVDPPPEIIRDISSYGITNISYFDGRTTPSIGDAIKVTVEQPDPAYQNNAKYYMEQAAAAASVAVKYTANQGLSPAQQAYARQNINAQVASNNYVKIASPSDGQIAMYNSSLNQWVSVTPDYITTPANLSQGWWLRYTASGWETQKISPAVIGALPSTLNAAYYGSALPTNPWEGRLFFVKFTN